LTVELAVVQLTEYAGANWRATFFVTGMAHSIVKGSADEPKTWRAVQRAAWGALFMMQRMEDIARTMGGLDGVAGTAQSGRPGTNPSTSDTFTDDAGTWEVVGQPRSQRAGKSGVATVQRPGDPGTLREQWWRAYERITVKRTATI
jgi:hypothetical protein